MTAFTEPSNARSPRQATRRRDHEHEDRDDHGTRDDPRPRQGRGAHDASSPAGVPARSWRAVAKDASKSSRQHHLTFLSAGVAFFTLLSGVPAFILLVSVYALLADPGQVSGHVDDVLRAAPEEVRAMVEAQMTNIVDGGRMRAGWRTVFSAAVLLWLAAKGTRHAITGVNIAYELKSKRSFVRKRIVAMAITVGAIAFGLVAFAIIALVPTMLAESRLGANAGLIAEVLRWPVVAGLFLVGLAIFYRYAPDRPSPKWRWASPGALTATALWLVGSYAFSTYVANFGNYSDTYGSLGAVVVTMLWCMLTAYAILLGAEVNAALERQTGNETVR